MPPRKRNAQVMADLPPTINDPRSELRRQLLHRPAQYGDGEQGGAPHGVHIADGIGGGNAAEIKGIVHDR